MKNVDSIIKTDLKEQFSQSFIDYGISVITDRAIPSVEDGLKPCLRRILWDMYNTSVAFNKPHQKNAKIVGSTMGRWHPHGDSSIYGALVGASQPWKMRYPLIDFHGNMGSRDGDGAASMRYTECRLNPLSERTLNGLKKKVVDFQSNYSETEDEPIYLPGIFPNLLCNGTTGIAVAMACNFLPHNLNEIMNCTIARLKEEEDPLQHIVGPDFPTGGLIINKDDLPSIYETGRGTVKVRGEYTIEKDMIVFHSIPYKVSKENLLMEINELFTDGKIAHIKEVRDETNKKGVRFCIECTKGNAEKVVKELFLKTKLQHSYSANQVALIKKAPKLLSTLEIIDLYIEHQKKVLRNEYLFDKEKIDARLLILDGLLKALEDIDNVIKVIKKSKDSSSAELALCETYDLLPIQAKAIVDMKLGRLAALESIKIKKEKEEKSEIQKGLIFVLNNQDAFDKALLERFIDFKDKFKDDRRTALTQLNLPVKSKKTKVKVEEVVELEEIIVAFTNTNFLKRIKVKTQRRKGVGRKVGGEYDLMTFNTNTLSTLMIFTSTGKMYQIKVKDIPDDDSGVSIFEFLEFEADEEVKCIVSLSDIIDKKIMFLTKKGRIKISDLTNYITTRKKKGIIALKLKEGDMVIDAKVIAENDERVLLYNQSKMIMLGIKDLPTHGRIAQGVIGIKMNEDESALGMVVVNNDKLVLVSKENTAKIMEIKGSRVLGVNSTKGGIGKTAFPKGQTILFIDNYVKDGLITVSNSMNEISMKLDEVCVLGIAAQGVGMMKNSKADLTSASIVF